MRRQPVITVHMRREEDARCVRDALASHSAVLMERGHRWDVSVDIRSRPLPDVLSALHACLDMNRIPVVHVTIDGRTYAMEPPLRKSRRDAPRAAHATLA